MGLRPIVTIPDQPSAQEKLSQPVPRPRQIFLRILTASAQIANRFLRSRRRMHLGQEAGAKQRGQFTGVPDIRLDPISCLYRNERWSNDDTVEPQILQRSLQRVPARPRFVADLYRSPLPGESAWPSDGLLPSRSESARRWARYSRATASPQRAVSCGRPDRRR
jgi:hypothetical protein